MTMVLETTQPERGLFTLITLGSIVALPFVEAMTINVGFPLKIYEILLLMAMLMVPLSGHLRFPASALPFVRVTTLWTLLVSILLMVKLEFPPASMSLAGLVTRFGPAGDGITKLVYLWLNLLAFMLFASQARRDESLFIRLWLLGAVISAIYSFYLFGMGAIGIESPPVLPGGRAVPFGFTGHVFFRNGTFPEGNYSGLYFIISAFLAWHVQRVRTGWVMIAATVTSFSTLAFIILVLLALDYGWRRFRRYKGSTRFLLLPIVFLALLGVGGALAVSAAFQATVVAKLTASEDSSAALSRVERLRTAKAGLEMFADNPLTGVGVSQFGYNINYYEPTSIEQKQIPNMVYMEFLSEFGLIPFAVFLISIWMAFRRACLGEERYLRFCLYAMLIGFFAYPTISVMYIWAFLGLLFGRLRVFPARGEENFA